MDSSQIFIPDDIDRKILAALQGSGRIKRNELAEMTGLSVPSVSERMAKLEGAGIISAYRAIIDHKKLGWDISAFILVTVDSSKNFKPFIERVAGVDEILECHAITGAGTHLIKVRAKNTAALEKLLSKIQSWQGVVNTLTHLVLSSPKETTSIPVRINDKNHTTIKQGG